MRHYHWSKFLLTILPRRRWQVRCWEFNFLTKHKKCLPVPGIFSNVDCCFRFVSRLCLLVLTYRWPWWLFRSDVRTSEWGHKPEKNGNSALCVCETARVVVVEQRAAWRPPTRCLFTMPPSGWKHYRDCRELTHLTHLYFKILVVF